MKFQKSALWLFLSKNNFWPIENKFEVFLIKSLARKTCDLFGLPLRDFLVSYNSTNSGIRLTIRQDCIGAYFEKYNFSDLEISKKDFINCLNTWQKLIKEQEILRNQL